MNAAQRSISFFYRSPLFPSPFSAILIHILFVSSSEFFCRRRCRDAHFSISVSTFACIECIEFTRKITCIFAWMFEEVAAKVCQCAVRAPCIPCMAVNIHSSHWLRFAEIIATRLGRFAQDYAEKRGPHRRETFAWTGFRRWWGQKINRQVIVIIGTTRIHSVMTSTNDDKLEARSQESI